MTEITNATLTITNITENGAAFGLSHGDGHNCYIPVSLAREMQVGRGHILHAAMIQNPIEANRERTPYMAVTIQPQKPEQLEMFPADPEPVTDPEPELSIEEVRALTRAEMTRGGVWTVNGMLQKLLGSSAGRMDNLQVYNAISAELRSMFAQNECSKWVMWRSALQTKASREWFSCTPDFVDVAEFEEDAE